MGETLEELQVIINAEIAPLKDDLSSATKDLQTFSKQTQKETGKIKSAFSSMKGFIGKVIATLGLAKLGAAAVSMASDVQEVENVVSTSFGSMRKYVDDFASNSISSFGMSELAAKRTASTYMAMSNGMGYVGDNAAKMAVNVSKLSGDLASFYNVSQEVADTALKSIWTGETETLKRFGVVMTQANLEQKAMEMGMGSSIQALSQQEQLILRYSFVMENLNLAQGDFAKTQGSWANQTRILSEQFKQLLAILGAGLIQVLTPALQMLNRLMGYLIAVAKTIASVIGGLSGAKTQQAGLADAQASINQSLGDIGGSGSQSMENLGKATKKASKEAKGALASFDELNVLTQAQSSDGGAAAGGSAGVSGGGVPAFQVPDYPTTDIGSAINTAGLESKVKEVMSWFGKLKDYIVENKKEILVALSGLIAGIVTYMAMVNNPVSKVVGIIKAFGSVILSAFTGISLPALAIATAVGLVVAAVVSLWQNSEAFRVSVLETWAGFQELFTTVISGIGLILNEFWTIYGKPIMDGLTLAWQNFITIIEQLWISIVKPIIDGAIALLTSLWKNVLEPVFSVSLTAIGEIITIALKLWNEVLSPFVTWFLKTFGPGIKTIIDSIVALFDGLFQTAKPIFDGLKMIIEGVSTALQGVIDFLVNVFKGDWDGAWNAMKQIVSGVVTAISGFFYGLFGGIIGFARTAVDSIASFFGGMATWFYNSVISPIGNFFGEMWQGIQDAASNAWNFILELFNSGGEIFTGIVNGVVGVFKSVVNWLIGGINAIIAVPFNAINGLLNNIKSISIFGFRPFDWIPYNALPVPKIPQLAVGTNYVAADGLAMLHKGEAVVPKKYNPSIGGGEQVALLQEQNKLLKALLDKDNSVYLDGDKLHNSSEKRRKQELDRFGLAY